MTHRERAALILVGLAFLAPACKREQPTELTAIVKRADFERVLSVRGHLEAVETLNVSAGTEGSLAFMAAEGTFVKAGDALFGLETKDKEEALQRVGLDLAVAESGLQRAEDDILSEVKKNEFSLEEKTRQLEFTRLSATIAADDLEKKHRQVDKQILPKSEIAAAELGVEQARLNVANAEIDLRRFHEESTSKAQTLKLDKRVAEARLEKARAEVDEARDFLAKATVKAPRAGVVIHSKNWRGTSYKIGDEVWNGAPVMELPDLSAMRIAVEINEVDVAQVAAGLVARVKIDAFPDLALPGALADISGMAVEVKDREGNPTGLRVFEAKVNLAHQDPRLRPGMTARVELVLETRSNALVVPTGAVGRDAKGAHVTLRDGSKRDVVIATSSSEYSVVESGLVEGDAVQLNVTDEPGAGAEDGASGASGASSAAAPPMPAAPAVAPAPKASSSSGGG